MIIIMDLNKNMKKIFIKVQNQIFCDFQYDYIYKDRLTRLMYEFFLLLKTVL